MLRAKTVFILAALASGAALMQASADVIAEDEGLYEKRTWDIQPRYDDLDEPTDSAGIITEGEDPANPSGPAVDFETRPGSLGLDYEESDEEEQIDP